MLRILLAAAFASSSHALTALAPLRAARLPAISSLPRMSAEEEEVPSALQGRPRFAPGRVVEAPVVEEEEAAAAAVDMAELEGLVTPINDLGEPDMLTDEKKKSGVVMDKLKGEEDNDGGISQLLGTFLLKLDPTGTVRRRLWTRADFMHIHAVSGGFFLFVGIPWLIASHASAFSAGPCPSAKSAGTAFGLATARLTAAAVGCMKRGEPGRGEPGASRGDAARGGGDGARSAWTEAYSVIGPRTKQVEKCERRRGTQKHERESDAAF